MWKCEKIVSDWYLLFLYVLIVLLCSSLAIRTQGATSTIYIFGAVIWTFDCVFETIQIIVTLWKRRKDV